MQPTRKRARIDEEDTLCSLPSEIWTRILGFTIDWLQVPFVCKYFYAIFDNIHYEPKRRLTPKARVKAIELSTRVFFECIATHHPIDTALLKWAKEIHQHPRASYMDSTEKFGNVFMAAFARHGGTADQLEELERRGLAGIYDRYYAISNALCAGNLGLFRHLRSRQPSIEIKDKQLMDWAFESGNAGVCQEIYESHLAEKRIALSFGEDPVMVAVRAGSIEIFRWTIQHGHRFEPKSVFISAASNDRLHFLRWFIEQYGESPSREDADAMLDAAIVSEDSPKDITILEYCLSLWRERRLADDGAVPPGILRAVCLNLPAFRWCIEHGATTDFEELVKEVTEDYGDDAGAKLKAVLDELGITYMQE